MTKRLTSDTPQALPADGLGTQSQIKANGGGRMRRSETFRHFWLGKPLSRSVIPSTVFPTQQRQSIVITAWTMNDTTNAATN